MDLYTSNRLEVLLEALATTLRRPLPPMQRELIIVQSRGMERWVSMQLAQRLGVWANGEFPFPRALAWRVFRQILPELPDTGGYEPEALQWSILALLPGLLERPQFAELGRYLHHDPQGLKHYQLAGRVAHSFDQYVAYRPEMVLAWERGEADHGWQTALWLALREHYGDAQQHRAAVRERFLDYLRDPRFDPAKLPSRLALFGVSALPPFYTDILNALGEHIPVSLFLLNPCLEYWGDIVSDTEIARRTTPKPGRPGISAEDLHLTKGNSLLASLGKLGRDFLDSLNQYNPQEAWLFAEPDESTLLGRLQSDILRLQERGDGADNPPPSPLALDDKSLQIHSCHSPAREVDVLHDQLLALLETDTELGPGDILVMTPDIELYAPFIQAVFSSGPEAGRLPFSIADRSARAENAVLDSFLNLLKLATGRFTLAEVLELLQNPALQARFQLGPAELDLVRHWLQHAGVRWGVDAADRAAAELPAFGENSWRFGLERLLLGYALPGGGERLFEGILPFDAIEGSAALALGQVLEFAENLFATCGELRQLRTLSAWRARLNRVLEEFFYPLDETDLGALLDPEELRLLRQTLGQLESLAAVAGFEGAVSLPVVSAWLEQQLEQQHAASGFITGGVTCCALLPMRSIPFKIICLLGLNDGAYPRTQRAPGFDLIAQTPRRGDRSRRNDDRYLFLECLLSARQVLYLSYQGQSVRDNSERPPSVLVTELLHYLEQACGGTEADPVAPRLVVKHPPQAFSRRYFNASQPRLFSYAEDYCRAGAALEGERRAAPELFLRASLPLPEADWAELDLEQLVEFFSNPVRFLLRRRLRLQLEPESVWLNHAEPFQLDKLESYQLNQNLLRQALAELGLESLLPVLRAGGALPPGQVGEQVYRELARQVRFFLQRLRPLLQGSALEPLHHPLHLAGVSVYGRLHALWPQQQLHYRLAKVKTKDKLRLWLYHLFLNAQPKTGYPRQSLYLGLDRLHRLPPLDHAPELLGELLECYRQGLSAPLRFFPEAALAYAGDLRQNNDPERALTQARKTWLGNDRVLGEADNLYYQQCFHAQPVLDDAFEALAQRIYDPLLTHLE